MALDLTETALLLDKIAIDIGNTQKESDLRLRSAIEKINNFDEHRFAEDLRNSSDVFNWTSPDFPSRPYASTPPSILPEDYWVVGVDGSHIDVNRHIPIRCFLVNTGTVKIRYGASPEADFSSNPSLYFGVNETYISDPSHPNRSIAIQGTILGAVRAVKEMKALADAIEKLQASDPHIPVLGLIDGTLLMLDLLRAGIPDFVLENILENGFLKELGRLKELSKKGKVLLASYISLPASTEVMDGVRLLACPYSIADCSLKCGEKLAGERPCDGFALNLLDRNLYSSVLKQGHRSDLYASNSRLVRNYYEDNQINFFYMNTGDEIARVEMPSWVSQDQDNLQLIHSIIYSQCRSGMGYPTSLMEAHEQAVISTADRGYFLNLIEEVVESQNMSFFTSRKDHSKRVRWL